MEKGDIYYEGYGTDDEGRTGVFRTQNKEEIIKYAKKAKNSNYIIRLKVEEIIPCEKYAQIDIFNLI